MLTDPTHVFHRMWGKWAYSTGVGQTQCWEVMRDNFDQPRDPSDFWEALVTGSQFDMNWQEGHGSWLGDINSRANYDDDAPGLLGFDQNIDWYCEVHSNVGGDRAFKCIDANVNILGLYGMRVPYNLCRNLEWQACAAQGKLPGQRTATVRFSLAPKLLDTEMGYPGAWHPLSRCSGFTTDGYPKCRAEGGAATDDIYYMEVCVFSQICENGDQLFEVEEGQDFHCQMSESGVQRLRSMLTTEPPALPANYAQIRFDDDDW